MRAGSGEKVTSRSPSAFSETPSAPAVKVSSPAVPMTTKSSLVSPRETFVSISGTFDSGENPGPKGLSERSTVRLSGIPAAPPTSTESVFAEVAAPHGTGTAPKRI